MSTFVRIGIAGSLVILAAACGGSQDAAPPASTPSVTSAPAPTDNASPASSASAPSSPTADPGSPEGGDCSNDVAVQKKCAAGLVCGPPKANAPISEHTPGVCKKP